MKYPYLQPGVMIIVPNHKLYQAVLGNTKDKDGNIISVEFVDFEVNRDGTVNVYQITEGSEISPINCLEFNQKIRNLHSLMKTREQELAYIKSPMYLVMSGFLKQPVMGGKGQPAVEPIIMTLKGLVPQSHITCNKL